LFCPAFLIVDLYDCLDRRRRRTEGAVSYVIHSTRIRIEEDAGITGVLVIRVISLRN